MFLKKSWAAVDNKNYFVNLQKNLQYARDVKLFTKDTANNVSLTPLVTLLLEHCMIDEAEQIERHWAELRLSVAAATDRLAKRNIDATDYTLIP